MTRKLSESTAFRFVLIIGIANLFADMTYEGARSSTGQFLGTLNAVIAGVVAQNKRSTAFGAFDTAFGIAWFGGSALMGILYEKSIPVLISFSVAMQLLSLPIFWFGKQRAHQ